jgi:two-component system cell cycle response regulator
VDHFKEVNDQHGHQVGDHVLVETAKILAGASRNIDLVARLGGEEFALLLPHTQPEGARLLVARIIERIGSSDLGPGDTAVRITVSAGVAAYPHHACRTRQELYKLADTALYAAKGAGRNRCILYDPDMHG